jgi:dipeptidase E
MGRHVVAMGGHAPALEEYVLELARGPRVCLLPTAAGDDPWAIVLFYEQLGARARGSHLRLFDVPPPDVRGLLLEQDVIYVAGGNTASMLGAWRAHGVDAILGEAWESGIVLCGWSAGANCWFEASVTDSFGPELAGLGDGLGLVPGSFCPHYDDESRQAVFRLLLGDGFPAGYAAENGVALHFEDAELVEAVSAHEGARGFRVDSAGSTPLPTKVL